MFETTMAKSLLTAFLGLHIPLVSLVAYTVAVGQTEIMVTVLILCFASTVLGVAITCLVLWLLLRRELGKRTDAVTLTAAPQ